MAYADQVALAQDSAFTDRVRMAIVTAAVQVMGEAKAGLSDAEYGKRQALAYAVLLSGGQEHNDRFAWAVASNVAITGVSLDSDIQFTVNSMWGDMAGVSEND